MTSLGVDHARGGEGHDRLCHERLAVTAPERISAAAPGYWIKMHSHIEVLDQPDSKFWMTTA
jgi:hypothetical protein